MGNIMVVADSQPLEAERRLQQDETD